MSRNRLLKGIGARGVGQAVTVLIRVFEVPLMFHFWGVNLYGEWLALIAIPAYLSMSDFGFNNVTARHMTMLVAAGKADEALGSFQSSYLLVTATSILIAAFLIFGVFSIEAMKVLSFRLIDPTAAIFVMALFSLKMVFFLQSGLYFGALQCVGKYPMGLLLVAATNLMEFLCLAVAVIAGASPVAAAGAACGGVGLVMLLFRIVVSREVPWIRLGWSHANLTHIRELWRPALSAMVFPLGQAMSYQGPRLAIGALIGPAAVAIFVAHRQLTRFCTLVLSIGSPIEAELSIQFGRGESDSYRRRAFRAAEAMIWTSLMALAFVISIGLLLFEAWTSGRLKIDHELLTALAFATFIEAVWRTVLTPVAALNRHMRVALGNLAVSIFLLVPGLYFLIESFGLIGAACALVIADAAMLVVAGWESMRLLQVNAGTWFIETFRPPFWILQEVRIILSRNRTMPTSFL